jgi:hypothetical protein
MFEKIKDGLAGMIFIRPPPIKPIIKTIGPIGKLKAIFKKEE